MRAEADDAQFAVIGWRGGKFGCRSCERQGSKETAAGGMAWNMVLPD
jgi:hypothetical protein